MKYINTKTQAVIETACVIRGDNWVQMEDQPKTNTPKKTSKKVVKKNE